MRGAILDRSPEIERTKKPRHKREFSVAQLCRQKLKRAAIKTGDSTHHIEIACWRIAQKPMRRRVEWSRICWGAASMEAGPVKNAGPGRKVVPLSTIVFPLKGPEVL